MRRNYLMLILVALCGFSIPTNKPAHLGISRVIENVKSINTLSYDFIKSERIDDELVFQHVYVKMQKKPFRVYLREVLPNEGVEILFPYEREPSKALVNTNGFPWVNVKLDPVSDLMRKNQHHTVLETGFDYMMSILEHALEKYESQIDQVLTFKGTEIVNGVACDYYTMTNPNFEYLTYTVKKGETVRSISRKYHVNEYMIEWKNRIRSDVKVGDVIKIPNDYSARLSIYVDREKQLPRLMKIYDDQGLFEEYGFENVVIDRQIPEVEFKESFAAYGF